MILADKIIRLRKKNGWSQEELAEKLNVSRQAVSKWEMAQTIPDLERILQMGELFGVTTDYLLKDELEDEEFTDSPAPSPLKRVSVEEANRYLAQRDRASLRIAFATFLCILSVIPLLLLGAASEVETWGISETVAGAVGLLTLICIVTAAVAVFLYCGFQNQPYSYLENGEGFELEYGVRGIVLERQKSNRSNYVKYNVFATCICILSPIPLILAAFTQREFLTVVMLTVTLLIAGLGVMLFIVAGVRQAAIQRLLREGEFSPEKSTAKNKLKERLESLFWALLVAGYLGWSFLSGDWHITWVVFPIGAVLNAALEAILDLVTESKKG